MDDVSVLHVNQVESDFDQNKCMGEA